MDNQKLFGEAILGSSTPAEFLGSVIQSSTEYSVIAKDLEGHVELWNQGAQRLYGYRPEEIIGKSADVLHAPEDIALGLPQRMREAAARDGRWEGVISRITKDALRITCRVVMTPRLGASGKPTGFVLISKDVSVEYRLRERIERSKFIDVHALGSSPEDLLEFVITLLQASTEYSIIGTGLDGGIVLWNEGARRLYGYDPTDVVGKANIAMLHTKADQKGGLPQTILGTALQSGFWAGRLNRVRKGGEQFAARVVVTPRLDAERRLLGFLVISHEVESAQNGPGKR